MTAKGSIYVITQHSHFIQIVHLQIVSFFYLPADKQIVGVRQSIGQLSDCHSKVKFLLRLAKRLCVFINSSIVTRLKNKILIL